MKFFYNIIDNDIYYNIVDYNIVVLYYNDNISWVSDLF